MIRVTDLTKRYGRKIAVDGISFHVSPGEVVGFLGPNGAGKTTTMRLLSCFLSPTAGSATIGGLDVSRHSLEVRRLIGYLPENAPLYPDMRVNEYLYFRAGLKGLAGRKRRERMAAVMACCGLEHVARQLIARLSKGHRQRVGLADCLVHDPQVLILDEPTLGLDPNQIREVRGLIRSLAPDHTVLLSTHILPEVEMTCGRVLIMNKGRIVASDTPWQLAHLMKGPAQLAAEVRGPYEAVCAALGAIPGVVRVAGERQGEWNRLVLDGVNGSDMGSQVFETVVQNGWSLRALHSERKSLEEVFAAVTGEDAP